MFCAPMPIRVVTPICCITGSALPVVTKKLHNGIKPPELFTGVKDYGCPHQNPGPPYRAGHCSQPMLGCLAPAGATPSTFAAPSVPMVRMTAARGYIRPLLPAWHGTESLRSLVPHQSPPPGAGTCSQPVEGLPCSSGKPGLLVCKGGRFGVVCLARVAGCRVIPGKHTPHTMVTGCRRLSPAVRLRAGGAAVMGFVRPGVAGGIRYRPKARRPQGTRLGGSIAGRSAGVP